jgi:5-methyltetrahydropteroyltriglutamate--homocysteine methyltransferase
MIEYFTRPLAGVRGEATFEELTAYRSNTGMRFRAKPPGVVDGPVGHGTLDLPDACRQARRLTDKPFKFTVTGPHMLAKTLLDLHYGNPRDLALAIADVLAEQVAMVDADIVQIDEANLPGHPEEADWAAEAINRVLRAVKTTPAVHLCFGNYGGQTIQSGEWAHLLGYLNALAADHIVMECARRPVEEIEVFKDLKPEIGFGLGVVDIKDNGVETGETVARRIEHAESVLGDGRVKFIHPDCGFWMLPRSVADAKIAVLTAGRDLFEGTT